MNSSCRPKPSRLAVLISLIIINARSGCGESSGEYLQKVMIELQELNVPSIGPMHDRLSVNLDYQDDHSQDNAYRKVNTNNAHKQPQKITHQNIQKPTASMPVADTVHSTSNNVAQYYAIQEPAATNYPKAKPQPQAEPLAFTRAELAALYKKALERGSAISLSSLTHALNAAGGGNAPLASGHVRLPFKHPMYNYYFFPLKSFASELQRDHQVDAIAPIYEATENTEIAQKQLMNPLFMAIGTFISMALLFMMGVLFLPKLPHLDLFNARVADDDFLRLTALVTNAIDTDNILEKFQNN